MFFAYPVAAVLSHPDYAQAEARLTYPHFAATRAFLLLVGDTRACAKADGIAMSDRGRVPASIVEQYQTATRWPAYTDVRRC